VFSHQPLVIYQQQHEDQQRGHGDAIDDLPLIKISIWSQVINGVAVPPLLVFMLLLVNNKGLMGEYVNTRLFNVIAWSTTIIMTVLNVVWFWMFGTGRG
ncbi:MAG TPA: divalent metal cation transporter, partial [Terriglobales bacterium]|nr:divalent metal cation transporter [Terriglobales bacterium]